MIGCIYFVAGIWNSEGGLLVESLRTAGFITIQGAHEYLQKFIFQASGKVEALQGKIFLILFVGKHCAAYFVCLQTWSDQLFGKWCSIPKPSQEPHLYIYIHQCRGNFQVTRVCFYKLSISWGVQETVFGHFVQPKQY